MWCIAPSRSESFGLVALEAAACGIPVVASAVGGLLSLVDDGRTGRLIDGRDPTDYARAVSEILGDDAVRASMSAAVGRSGAAVHLELRRRPIAAAVRRSHRARAGELSVTDAYDPGELAELEHRIDGWLAALAAENDRIIAVDRDTEAVRWYVRMRGDDKEFTTVWLTLGQRTLRYETYVMPAPEENDAELYEHLLRRNDRLVGAHFSIGHRGCDLPAW